MILRLTFLLMVLSGLTGSLAYWLIPIPAIDSTDLKEETWKPFTLPKPVDIQAIAVQLRKQRPWEPSRENETSTRSTRRSKSARRSRKKPLNLVGIVQQGRQSYILLLEKNHEVKSYPLNSSLPNGTRLVSIYEDSIEILEEDEFEIVKLYD